MSFVLLIEDGQRKVEVRTAHEATGLAALRYAFGFFGIKPTEDQEVKPMPEASQKTPAAAQDGQETTEEKRSEQETEEKRQP